jgi:acyl transferase domain-containing protein
MSKPRSLLQESLVAIERLQARLDASECLLHQPIAIIGAGCRYPGSIESPEELWRVVRDGIDAVTEVPADRWDVDAYYDPDPKAPGKMTTRRGGFLSQVDRFDPQFFGISPREATTMDPQQRLLLETSYEALESAGVAADQLAGSRTGVFVGITLSEYAQLLRLDGLENNDVYSATGTVPNAAAGRISFTFGFQGPCISVDTACSSSLVAVHMACQSLRTGESNLALAGGVNVVLSPDAMVMYSKWGMMAPDGACKTFDAAADGFVRAEGCAVIALKRLADAIAADDPILAVIRGSAVNSDGRSSGLTVPNGPAQQAVLRAALTSARLKPSEIDYVEAHGTGTSLGDPIEVEALGAVMREGRAAERPLGIGSIKTNFGHTEAASGLAGLLKVAMALRHEAIPPHLHFSTPNPGIPWSELPVKVLTKLTAWPRSAVPRRAGVSSFGFSGTNAHVILEEAPLRVAAQPAAPPYLVPLSARDEDALRATARRLADRLATHDAPALADVAGTLATGRAHFLRRVALIADSSADLQRQLRAIASGQMSAAAEGNIRAGQQPKIAFLFTGQGAQYAGMGRQLYETEPVFRAVLDKAAMVLAPVLERPFLETLFSSDEPESALSRTAYTQPALFAVEYALAELWRSWGIVPSVVAGHSVGEYVAACVAGVFSFEDALALVAERGQLMQTLPTGGGMAAIFADEARVAARVAAVGDQLCIAAVNGPEETVVAGDSAALAKLVDEFTELGVNGKILSVSHAFHSRRLDPVLDALEQRAASIAHAVPRILLVSNLTGAVFAPGTGPDARYWRRHAREPVRFAAGIAALRAAGVTALVEVGPHPALLALVARAMPDAPWSTTASLRRGRDDRREMLAGIASLYAQGAPVRWDVLTARLGGRRISLPTYPFQRERYWVAAARASLRTENSRTESSRGHPLLGERHQLASAPGTDIWECDISLETHPWLTDHRVQGAAIVPATAYIEMALAAAGEVLGSGPLSVREIENLKPITLLHDTMHRVQSTLVVESDGTARFTVHGRRLTGGADGANAPWTTHMTARLALLAEPCADQDGLAAFEAAKLRASSELSGESFYAALAKKGNQWGPCFQGMQHLWRGDGEVLGRVRLVPALAGEMARYRLHPAVADSCAHTLVAIGPLEASNGAYGGALVGGGVGEIRFYRSPVGQTLWTRAKLRPQTNLENNVLTGDIWIYDESGALVSETLEARLWYLDENARSALLGVPLDWYYKVCWQRQLLGGESRRRAKEGTWVLFADEAGIADRIAAARSAAGRASVLVSRADTWSVRDDRITIRPENPEDYERLLAAVEKPAAILHLWSLDSLGANKGGDASAAGAMLGAESTLQLLHGIRNAANAPRPRLWLVTSSTQAVVQSDACDAPWSAALWGLGKSLSAEHSELWGGLIDLATDIVAERDAKQILREVDTATAEDKVAFRGGERFVARLERRSAHNRGDRKFSVSADGTYLITGGMGGIGLAMARWLVERGARHLLLLGRTPLPPRHAWARLNASSAEGRRVASILAIEALGANVQTSAVDVADSAALRTCLEVHEAAGQPNVCGVIHAAGVLQLQALESQSIASFREGLAAKAAGAWNLHRLLSDRALDCFVLCSSTSALLNSPLLGGYAAGNSILDALAHHRRARGLSALSVNWGTWREIGMAVDAGRGAQGSMLSGIDTIPTALGLDALGELLADEDAQSAVVPVDWRLLARSYPDFAADPFLQSLLAGANVNAGGTKAVSLTLALLHEMEPEARAGAVGAYLRVEAARVLGFAPERLDISAPLSSFGFDSLMAVQLKNRIEADTGAIVPMIQFLQGPSVEQLVCQVLEAAEALEGNLEVVTGDAIETWEEGSL